MEKLGLRCTHVRSEPHIHTRCLSATFTFNHVRAYYCAGLPLFGFIDDVTSVFVCECVFVCVCSHISDILRSVEHNTSQTGHPSLCSVLHQEKRESSMYVYNPVGPTEAGLVYTVSVKSFT